MTITQEIQNSSTALKVDSALDSLKVDWLNFIDVSQATFITYGRCLTHFTSWIASNNISNVTRETVIMYRDSLLYSHKATTARLYMSCLKLFIKFLASKGICADFTAHLKGVKVNNEVHARDALNVDESRQVFHAMRGADEKSLRDKAIVGLMLATGLRCVEVTRLDVADIQKRGNKIFLRVFGKGRSGKTDSVIIPAQVYSLIRDYLASRAVVKKDAPLFVSTSRRNAGQRLQAQTISRLCKRALVKAGFDSPRLTAHSLRHSFATNAIGAGVELRQVSKALRHKSIVVTEIYLHDLDAFNNPCSQAVAKLIL